MTTPSHFFANPTALTFQSEADRMQHTQARLIPVNVWDHFFNASLSRLEQKLIRLAPFELESYLEENTPAPTHRNPMDTQKKKHPKLMTTAILRRINSRRPASHQLP